jgi:DNA (cytosine-5)-methyltransferase 1
MRPLLLDLFCGAGGAAMGYHRAGFDVVGVDIKPQPHYPFEFIQGDAMNPPVDLDAFDVIHASPPCQAYSAGARMREGYAKEHPRLIEPVRDLLIKTGLPYVIENVPEAPLLNPIRLCGSSFGISSIEGVRRHRGFETSVPMMAPPCAHGLHQTVVGVYGDHPEDSVIRKGYPAIRARSVEHAAHVMGIDWMKTWPELKEAIPPAYTEFIGTQLLERLARTG